MAKTDYLTAPVPSSKIPSGIPYILANEAGERFSFYGTRCILVIFMTKYLLDRNGALAVMTPEQSKAWFHLFVSAVYFTPIIGALLSDIWLGKYRTILYFSILYCIGFFALAFDNTRLGLGIGLTLIAIGSGIIKGQCEKPDAVENRKLQNCSVFAQPDVAEKRAEQRHEIYR